MTGFHPLAPDTRARLEAAELNADAVAALVRAAVEEDLAGGIDVTSTATVPAAQHSVGEFRVRAPGTVAGLAVAVSVIDTVCGDDVSDEEYVVADGDRVGAGAVLLRVTAPTRSLLTAERTSLNLLCHLSGIATATGRWVDALAGSSARVRDTRKTNPGLRAVEKYAVRCGGGLNHRMSLSDAALVKDNHVLAAGGVAAAFAAVRALDPDIALEVEVDSFDQLHEALVAGAETIMFDNFSVEEMHAGVAATREYERSAGRRVMLEASGGLTLETARLVAATGVDYIAVGALTHSAPVLDIGLDLISVR